MENVVSFRREIYFDEIEVMCYVMSDGRILIKTENLDEILNAIEYKGDEYNREIGLKHNWKHVRIWDSTHIIKHCMNVIPKNFTPQFYSSEELEVIENCKLVLRKLKNVYYENYKLKFAKKIAERRRKFPHAIIRY